MSNNYPKGKPVKPTQNPGSSNRANQLNPNNPNYWRSRGYNPPTPLQKKKPQANKPLLPPGTFRNSGKGKNVQVFDISSNVLNQLAETISRFPAEKGGMLGGLSRNKVTKFVFDQDAQVSGVEYTPNIDFLNRELEQWWNKSIQLIGIIHTHPPSFMQPSSADLEYSKRILDIFTDLPYFFLPICRSSKDGNFAIYPYYIQIIEGKPVAKLGRLLIDSKPCEPENVSKFLGKNNDSFNDDFSLENILNQFQNRTKESHDKNQAKKNSTIEPNKEKPIENKTSPTFSRISSTLDLNLLKNSVIFGVGCGGARDYYLDMARSGVGHFILYDGDKITQENLSVQGVYTDEIGEFKVEAIRKRILAINPDAKVIARSEFFNDQIKDADFHSIIKNYQDQVIILTAFTDNFLAQARLSRLAIKYQLPFISAQHWQLGHGSEVFYWSPDKNQHCQRCMLQPRYHYYLVQQEKNKVTSQGSPIFHTTRLNALCEKITVGLLMRRSSIPNYLSYFLENQSDKNLIIIRNHPDLPIDFSMEHFFNNPYSFMDDPVWLSYDDLYGDQTFDCVDCEYHKSANQKTGIIDSRIISK